MDHHHSQAYPPCVILSSLTSLARGFGVVRTAANGLARHSPMKISAKVVLECRLGTGHAAGPDGYSACPGATTMQGCWLAASRAQAAFAALADRLLRRARYNILPPKAELGKSSIWAEVSRSTSAS
jgi:hypothetical protein